MTRREPPPAATKAAPATALDSAVTSDTIRIAVVDDHPLMRDGIVQALRRQTDFSVVAEGQSARDAIKIAETHLPDVMLIDVNMPGNGIEALKTIARTAPAIATIIITVRDDEETVTDALRSGAKGYVLKGISAADLCATVRSIHAGDVYITPSLAARLLSGEGSTKPAVATAADKLLAANYATLTERELQILRHIAKGRINKEIAASLEISEKTVKHYVTNILQKLQVRNRVEAAIMAQRDL